MCVVATTGGQPIFKYVLYFDSYLRIYHVYMDSIKGSLVSNFGELKNAGGLPLGALDVYQHIRKQPH